MRDLATKQISRLILRKDTLVKMIRDDQKELANMINGQANDKSFLPPNTLLAYCTEIKRYELEFEKICFAIETLNNLIFEYGNKKEEK